MKVLVVTPWVPTTRRPRSLQFIKMLSAEHEVRVISAAWSADEESEAASIGAPTETVRMAKATAVLRVLVAVIIGKSLQQAFVDSSRFRRRLVKVESDFDPDIVVFNVLRSAHLVTSLRNNRSMRILDLDEFRSKYYAQVRLQSTSLARRVVATVEAKRMTRAEDRAVQAFDRCLVSSPRDLRPSNDRIRLVRSAHLLPDGVVSEVTRTRGEILFVGRMSYSANEEAMLWFARVVWPTVSAQHPSASLLIVGEGPSKAIRRLASERVQVVGKVPSVDPYFRRAAITIVPITMATGVQMKLIEGLASGTPTIATPLVAELAGAVPGRDCLVASSPSEWASAVHELLENPGSAAALASRGRTWLDEHHSPEAVAAQLRRALEVSGPQ